MSIESNLPLVAIRCITYNHELYIRDALDGFIMQKTDFPFVAIVHDDASTDGTADIIREYVAEYPDIIKPIYETENQYSKKDGSIQRIMQKACEETGAKYIALCEGDDFWTDPFKLQKQVDILEANPEIGMCYTKTRYLYQSTKKYGNKTFGGPYTIFRDFIINPYCVPTATILVKTILYKKALEDHILKNRWEMGDFPLTLSLSLYSRIYFLNEETSVYRVLMSSGCHFNNLQDELFFLTSVYDVKKYFINISKVNISSKELEDAYNFDVWKRGITHCEFSITKKYGLLCHPDKLKYRLLKFISIHKILFNLYCKYKHRK